MNAECPCVDTFKKKRNIVNFKGDKPMAINLDHVTQMLLDGLKITFTFYSNAVFIDFDNEEAAKSAFDSLLNIWANESSCCS